MKTQLSLLIILLVTLLSLALAQVASAGSATWNLNPTTGDWNTAANWTPATIPNGSADTAAFGVSNITGVSLSANTEVESIVFNPGASAFTITVSPGSLYTSLTISGAGIVNNSSVTQNFVTTVSATGQINFTGSATAGSSVVFTNLGGSASAYPRTHFTGNSSAGSATFINKGGSDHDHIQPGAVDFVDNSTAESGTFICRGGDKGALGGVVGFYGNSTAANGTFIGEGGADKRAAGALIQIGETTTAGDGVFTLNGTDFEGSSGALANFIQSSTAGNATLIANGGALAGGKIRLASTGGTARIEVFGNGNLDISARAPGVTIGSLEGDGLVFLGPNNLTIGSNNLSTIFSGVIQDSGSVTKIGRGRLTLAGANTYTGVTTVSQGTVLVRNTTGSGTGTGAVQVDAGSLGGTGIIAGAVTLGTGAGHGALLSPGSKVSLGTLTIQSTLTFKADSSYDFALNSSRVAADKVIARGVTISSGALLSLVDNGNGALPLGTTFTVISNTAATAIAGAFDDLADGSTVTIGSNTFQADYEGGDGNDLTLTVIP